MTLSIITINYNNLEGLRNTMESVLSQTWHDYEWIIIDGGSTDGSKELIEEIANKLASSDFNPLSYWCSEPDKGIYNAMNKGISKVNGNYINFMNSGDLFYNPSVLAKVFSEKLYGEIIYGDWYEKYHEEKKYKSLPPESLLIITQKENICHQATFYKACILKERGYDENFKILSDWARVTEELFKGTSFQHLPFPICYYDMYGICNTCSKETLFHEHKQIWNKCPQQINYLLNLLKLYQTDYYISNCINLLYGNRILNLPLRLVIRFLSLLKKNNTNET